MDWIAIGTLVAALVAAVGAVWAAIISQRQFALAKEAAELPLPLVTATPSPVDHQPAWTCITIEMRNRAQVAIDLLKVSFEQPAGGKMLPNEQVYKDAEPSWEPRPMVDTFPAELASGTVSATAYLNRVGTASKHDSGEFNFVTVFAHLPPSRFTEEPQPRLILEMRWRDHTTKTFAMAVNVIKPSVT
ncbi:hypothetical protein [Aquamicrobium soli]|uniref:DUF3426 domain-containing protein n=1 Tax=Aquamicrobium soli TaxID=1811518 RepID=A0ABV7KCR4_9HYPH